MNLSESLRHYANLLLEDTAEQVIKKAIDKWNQNAGKADLPPKDPNDGLSPNQPPTPDWSAGLTYRWLLQYGDTRLANKRSRHKPLNMTSLPSVDIMLRERDWHDFVRYYRIFHRAYFSVFDEPLAAELKPTFDRLHKEFKRRQKAIELREYEKYDMEAKVRRDHPNLYKDPEDPDGGLEW